MEVGLRWTMLIAGVLFAASCGNRRMVKELTPDGAATMEGLVNTVSDTCIECHAIVGIEWAASTHADVSCASCHVYNDAILGSARSPESPHPITVVERYQAWTMCLGCHARSGPGEDVFADWLAWQQNTWRGATCVDCHLPIALRLERTPPRPGYSHGMPGPSDVATAKDGVTLRALQLQEDGVLLPLANKTGHRFPASKTSVVEVFALALGDEGETIGQGTAWLRRQDGDDTRLLPGELRNLRFRFGPEELARTVSYRVSLRFHLDTGEVLDLGHREEVREGR